MCVWQSLNPFYVFNECLGPSLCRKFCCCLSLLVLVLVAVFGAPFLSSLQALLPSPWSTIIIIAFVAIVCAAPTYLCLRAACCADLEDEEAEDMYAMDDETEYETTHSPPTAAKATDGGTGNGASNVAQGNDAVDGGDKPATAAPVPTGAEAAV